MTAMHFRLERVGLLLLSLLALVTAQHLPDYAQRNLETIRKIYNLTVYPNNVPIIKGGASKVPPELFSKDAVGRVVPVGTFSGFADSIEYFFALAPDPSDSEFQGAGFYQADVVEFTSGCPDVAASLVYFRTAKLDKTTGKPIPGSPVSTLSQIAFWQFDASGAVQRYHAIIPILQGWILAATGGDFSSFALQKITPAELCPLIQKRCTGSNQQYLSVVDCIAELDLKPFGSFDEAWGDTVACRVVHLILTQVRPDIHCPHVGPSGGGKCVPIQYSKDYFADAELFGKPEGSVFTCGGPLISATNPASVGLNNRPSPGEVAPLIPEPGPLSGLLYGILKRMPDWL